MREGLRPPQRQPGTTTGRPPTRHSTVIATIVATCISREMRMAAPTPNRVGIERSPCCRSNSTSWQAYRMSNPATHNPMARPSSQGSSPPPAAGGDPAADRRHRHGQAEKQLRVRRVPLRKGVPEDNRERDRRQQQAQRAESSRSEYEHRGRHHDEQHSFGRRHSAARQFAHRRPRVQRVGPGVDHAVKPHGGAPRAHHADDDPERLRPEEALNPPGQQRARERERQRKH